MKRWLEAEEDYPSNGADPAPRQSIRERDSCLDRLEEGAFQVTKWVLRDLAFVCRAVERLDDGRKLFAQALNAGGEAMRNES